MSAGKGYCTRHQHDMANRLQFLGLWKLVKAQDAQIAADITLAWLHGQLRREMICPLTILMLEISAKADRMAQEKYQAPGAHVATCPLCSIQRISDDEAADVKVIKGMCDQVILPLMKTNGLVPDGSVRGGGLRRQSLLVFRNPGGGPS